MQTGLEKNLFGNHPVSLPSTESRSPPPAFASDPLMPIGGREYDAGLSPSVGKDSEIVDIVEIDGPGSASPSVSNHESTLMKSSSPPGVRMFCFCLSFSFHGSFFLLICAILY